MTLAVALWAVGALSTLAFARTISNSNPDKRLPWVGRFTGWTIKDVAFYSLGFLSVLLGSASAGHHIGPLAGYGIGLGCLAVPLLTLQGLHNRRVGRSRVE